METDKSVLILDENCDYRETLKNILSHKGYTVVESTNDTDRILELLSEKRIDLLITDILLFSTDGLEFIKTAAKCNENGRHKILVCSHICDPEIVSRAIMYGAADYVPKHIPVHQIANHIDVLCSTAVEKEDYEKEILTRNLEKDVSALLSELGIPAKLKGYHYIRYAIIRTLEAPESATAITKTIYPELIKNFGATDKSAERAIRTAIERIWKTGYADVMAEHFGYVQDTRPSNGVFVAMMADKLRMENKNYRKLYKSNEKIKA